MPINMTRRDLLVILSSIGLGFILSVKYQKEPLGADINIKLSDPNDIKTTLYEIFLSLSLLITSNTSLNTILVEKVFHAVCKEPWAEKHIVSSYRQILFLLDKYTKNSLQFNRKIETKLGNDERWFIMHLLTTYYLGVHYHTSSETKRITYDDALMFNPIKQYYPLAFKEAVGYGNWYSPVKIH